MNPKLEHFKLKIKDSFNSTTLFLITIMKISENNFFKILKRKEKLNFKLPIISLIQQTILRKEELKNKQKKLKNKLKKEEKAANKR